MPDHVVSLVPRIHESQNAHGIVPERIESIDGSKESKYVHDTRAREEILNLTERARSITASGHYDELRIPLWGVCQVGQEVRGKGKSEGKGFQGKRYGFEA